MHVLLDIKRILSLVDPLNLTQRLNNRLDPQGRDSFAKTDDPVGSR